MPSAIRCPSCGYALFEIDSPPIAVSISIPASKSSISIDPPPPNTPLLLRIPEAAALLGISRSTMYQLVARGELPVVRIGRSVRIARAAVERMAG